MARLISQDIINLIAKKADWKIGFINRIDRIDYTTFSGDGVDDIDSVLRLFDRCPHAELTLDVGESDASIVTASRDDIQALRDAYVLVYGEVNKPNVFDPPYQV